MKTSFVVLVGKEFISKIIDEMLKFMMDMEEDENWAFKDDLEDNDIDSNPVTGESSLDRFACGLGGKAVLPIIREKLEEMLKKSDWKIKHAALMAVRYYT